VVDGEKDASYAGTIRGGYGNPFDAWTVSENPLATDLTGVIVSALTAKGFQPRPVELGGGLSAQDAVKESIKGDEERVILLTLKEWRTDTYIRTSLYVDVLLKVLDGQGRELAAVTSAGEDDLGGNAWNPPAHAREETPKATKKRIEQLLNHPDVIDALKR